ncbi:MAG: hypothetical protein JW832_08060 [Deltaproteobacteria bacterium]|nr:hypothetical protein [Deltaproteobacteria bacterium]
MTHENAGHYAAKHSGAAVNPEITAQLTKHIIDGRISCTAAHAVAQALSVTPKQVGIAIDLLEARIVQCQLGLFGWDEQLPAAGLPVAAAKLLQQAIQAALAKGRLPCPAAWKIAQSQAVAKPAVKEACDRLNIKICGCQLGAFS